MTDIKAQFDPNLRKSIKRKRQVAVIPIGSIEQHGPHLPISTDTDIVTVVAERICEKMDISYFQLCPMEYHLNMLHFSI